MSIKMNIPFSPPDITQLEIDEVIDALQSGWITTGPKTKLFEEELAKFCGTSKFVTTNSATIAMELVLRMLGVKEGDEVITTSYTYTASASVIEHVGAKIVLVDTQKDSYEMDYDQLSNSITSKTKVILPVDIAGVMCDYDKIYNIVNEKKHLFNPAKDTLQDKFDRIIILADAAHSLGASYKGQKSGQVADFSCFSFHAVKNLTTAEGGAITWRDLPGIDDDYLYQQFMYYILHGQSKDAFSKNQLGAWEYDIIGTYYKANMTDINAALGLAQLKRYPDILKRRKDIITKYNNSFENLPITPITHYDNFRESSGHLYIMSLNEFNESQRNDFILQLAEEGIACNVHYKPLPMFTAYKNMGFDINDFPNAFNFYKNEVTLPLHTKLTDEEIDYIINTIKKIFN